MDDGEDARGEELDNLRLALATFALQLDAFEMRMRGARLAAGLAPGIPVLQLNRLQASVKENVWASIKSPGNKSDT